MANHTLTAADKEIIKSWTEHFSRGLDALEKARQLKVGDYLVLYIGHDHDNLTLQTNSYGAPTKYLVVHSTEHGIPFIKKVNKKGTPFGELFSCTGALDTDTYVSPDGAFEFRLDPDYADSIILQDPSYDPAVLHKVKQEIWKEVTKHNKKAKIDTSTLTKVVDFFKNVNIGDTVWTSHNGFYLVQDKQTMSRQDFKNNLKDNWTNAKGPWITVLTVLDKKSKTHKITADFFVKKVLYKERPRTYKELNT